MQQISFICQRGSRLQAQINAKHTSFQPIFYKNFYKTKNLLHIHLMKLFQPKTWREFSYMFQIVGILRVLNESLSARSFHLDFWSHHIKLQFHCSHYCRYDWFSSAVLFGEGSKIQSWWLQSWWKWLRSLDGFWEKFAKSFREFSLKFLRHEAVDEKIGGEVEHDQEMGYGLQAHDEERRYILINMVQTGYLVIWKKILCNLIFLNYL